MAVKKFYCSSDARTHFSKIINAVIYYDQETFILHYNLPIAKICPISEEEKEYIKNLLIKSDNI